MYVGEHTEEADHQISTHLQAFWELQHLSIIDRLKCNYAHDTALKRFCSTAKLQDGRYIFRLLWKLAHGEYLGDNKVAALQRLRVIRNKLLPNQVVTWHYDNTIRE